MRVSYRTASATAIEPEPDQITGHPESQRVIVLAITTSPSAEAGIICAGELASTPGVGLRIIHVLAPVMFRVGRLAPMRPVQTVLPDPFDSTVLRHARSLAWRHGAAATLQLLTGDPAPAVLSATTAARASCSSWRAPTTRADRARAAASTARPRAPYAHPPA
jgi:hypothetical protein